MDEIGAWWPLSTHSIAADEELGGQAVSVRIERGVGGRILEIRTDGTEIGWGPVLTWAPPSCLVLAWDPNRTRAVTTEVEVDFSPIPSGTLVRVEHRGWERLGDRADVARSSYEAGWPRVLDRYEVFVSAI